MIYQSSFNQTSSYISVNGHISLYMSNKNFVKTEGFYSAFNKKFPNQEVKSFNLFSHKFLTSLLSPPLNPLIRITNTELARREFPVPLVPVLFRFVPFRFCLLKQSVRGDCSACSACSALFLPYTCVHAHTHTRGVYTGTTGTTGTLLFLFNYFKQIKEKYLFRCCSACSAIRNKSLFLLKGIKNRGEKNGG